MVRNNVFCQIEPELGHLSQNSSFFRNDVIKNHIKTADAVRSNHNQAVTVIIDFTYFSFFDWFHLNTSLLSNILFGLSWRGLYRLLIS